MSTKDWVLGILPIISVILGTIIGALLDYIFSSKREESRRQYEKKIQGDEQKIRQYQELRHLIARLDTLFCLPDAYELKLKSKPDDLAHIVESVRLAKSYLKDAKLEELIQNFLETMTDFTEKKDNQKFNQQRNNIEKKIFDRLNELENT